MEIPVLTGWTLPLAWVGDPPLPVADWAGEYPVDAAFVRGFFRWTLRKPIGPGMCSESEVTGPALIRLEAGKPVEALGMGPDGVRWDYRLEKQGRRKIWVAESCSPLASTVEYTILQSFLPERGSRKYISIRISSSGQVENFATSVDPEV